MNRISFLLLLVLIAVGTTQAAEQKIRIRFDARVGSEPFVCGRSYEPIGRSQSRITPSDFRFYVSHVELITAQGKAVPVKLEQDGVWQYRDLALLDFEGGSGPCRNGNTELHTAVVGRVAKGQYRGLRFTLGVPFDLNHGDPTLAESPLNLSAMFWAWQSGYKFLKIDMATSGQSQDSNQKEGSMQDKVALMAKIDQMKKNNVMPAKAPARAAGFSVHLGSTGCASSSLTSAPQSCANPNRLTVTFDHFDSARNVVVADLMALLQNTDVDQNAPDSAPGCMSAVDDDDCPAVMSALGLPFRETPATLQTFFSVK